MHRSFRFVRTLALPHRRCISVTPRCLDKITIQVPTMGDSITEGTIVEWTAQIGQTVQEDDIVALVETDKVTVEIKAEMSGVITQQFGVIDDTVEVGAKLYEIDTDATAAVSTKDAPKSEAKKASVESEPKAGPSKKATPPPNASKTPARTPSIHFLGKEGWASRLSGQKLNQPQVVYIPPMYGRPKFTQEEMDALITGGADLAPSVLDYSRGAKFQAF